MKHFLTLADFSKEELEEILTLSLKIKTEIKNKVFKDYLPKQVLGMIFEKVVLVRELALKQVSIN